MQEKWLKCCAHGLWPFERENDQNPPCRYCALRRGNSRKIGLAGNGRGLSGLCVVGLAVTGSSFIVESSETREFTITLSSESQVLSYMARMSISERRVFFLEKLEEHRHLLRTAIAAMGTGDLIQGLTVATSIRVLVHETGSSIPLLKRLRHDYLDLQIYVPKEVPEDPRFSDMHKTTIMKIPASVRFGGGKLPSVTPTLKFSECETLSLGIWWTRPCLIMPGCQPLSRKDIVLGLANKEGAHVDDDMPPAYRSVVESKAIQIKVGDSEVHLINVTRFVCGSAGVELLDCLDRNFRSA
jgi:hypothetical protein